MCVCVCVCVGARARVCVCVCVPKQILPLNTPEVLIYHIIQQLIGHPLDLKGNSNLHVSSRSNYLLISDWTKDRWIHAFLKGISTR